MGEDPLEVLGVEPAKRRLDAHARDLRSIKK